MPFSKYNSSSNCKSEQLEQEKKNHIAKIPKYPNTYKTSDFVLLNGKTSHTKTYALLSHDLDGLIIDYVSNPNIKFVGESSLLKCNSDLWKQQVCEIFIRPKYSDPQYYLELEINPFGFLWVTMDYNKGCKRQFGLKNIKYPCAETGIIYHSTLSDYNNTWKSHLKIPWHFLHKLFTKSNFDKWMVNLFCQRMKSAVNICKNNSQCEFTTWSPTGKYEKPDYHICNAFREIEIVN